MNRICAHSPSKSSSEAGYALLMAVFLVATLLLAASMSVPSVLTEGRREMEQEVIWRGNQYVRAIRLYYQKNGRFPQSMDDLTKASNNGTYFLRKAYTDLSDPEDQGSWRMIYASPSGQLIGSVRYTSLQQMALAQGMAAAQNNALQAAAAAGTATPGGSQSTDQSSQASGQPQGEPSGQPSPQAGPMGQTLGSAQSSPFASQPISSGPLYGGYLVGVGCKLKRPSQIVYHGGKTYEEWEFIWNPLTVTAVGGSQSVAQPGQAAPNSNGPGSPGAPGASAIPGAPAPSSGSGASPAPAPPANGETLQFPSDSPTPSPSGDSQSQSPAAPGF